MTRIHPISAPSAAAKDLLGSVQAALGITPNMMKTMAHSPAALQGYLSLSGALAKGVLDGKFREQIALAVAQANACDYCLSAHSVLGAGAGLTAEDISAARKGRARDGKAESGLKFAQQVARNRGQITDDDLSRVKQAGYSDAEIAEVIAHVALNVFTNYFNTIAQTEIDFPKVSAA
jgi:uncharacterized peroxidase-related enzyme